MASFLARVASRRLLFVVLFVGAVLLVPLLAAAARGPQQTPSSINIPVAIPKGASVAELDGYCRDYEDALEVNYVDAPFPGSTGATTGTVFLKHDGSYLYVCLQATPGSNPERYASVYLDPQGDGASYEFAKENDYSLRQYLAFSETLTLRGKNTGGYEPFGDGSVFWEATIPSPQTPNGDFAEYKISYGRFFIEQCEPIRLAVYHEQVLAPSLSAINTYGWPSADTFDKPRSWQLAYLDNDVCNGLPTPTMTPPKPGERGKVAYVFRGDDVTANAFKALLEANLYSVELITLREVLSKDFNQYQLIIIADDTGDLNEWGITAPDLSAAQVAKITEPNPDKPILGLGEGGYAFFGKLSLFIGWPNGWHGPQDSVLRPAAPGTGHYTNPYVISDSPLVKVYNEPVNEVGIYLNPRPLPAGVVVAGLEPPAPPNSSSEEAATHANLILQGCKQLWGFSGGPGAMTETGKQLFVNAATYARFFQCAPEEPPPANCVNISKAAVPAGSGPGTAPPSVAPGTVISYTISYVFSNSPNCELPERARLLDYIPAGTAYVPDSASAGGTLTADGALAWVVTPAAGTQTRSFAVKVLDTPCRNDNERRRITNKATLLYNDTVKVSDPVIHGVTCPPIVFPNDDYPYIQREIQIHPYPFYRGWPSDVSVQMANRSSSPQRVKVSFQIADGFGIGLPYRTFDVRYTTIPANGVMTARTQLVPDFTGLRSVRIMVEENSNDPAWPPIYTERSLDNSENLRPGIADTLQFEVANPLSASSDIRLVILNRCPGWQAEIVGPNPLLNVGPNNGDVRTVALQVTPPATGPLGSQCKIDVQGWAGNQLIGGFRKLDVPPVNLPTDVLPRWKEPEISLIPNPPVAGVPGRLCVLLQNPLATPRTVEVEYQVADFGAGISFTTVQTRSITLPANSIDNYCIIWTPSSSGTDHRCVQVILRQEGFQPMRSQRNVNIQRVRVSELSQLRVPLRVGNPDGVAHDLDFLLNLQGLDPGWEIFFIGTQPPETLQPNQVIDLVIGLRRSAALAQTGSGDALFGDDKLVEVAVLLDGEEVGGFSVAVELGTRVYLPMNVR
jgi:uncharacterized repeat protein (TIGR01451 family)